MGNPEISFKDLTNMTIDLSTFKKDTQRIRNVKKCDICKVKVETFKSSDRNSVKHCHIHCALQTAYFEPEEAVWKTYFAISNQEGLFVHQTDDDQDILVNLEDIAFNLKGVLDETGLSKEDYEPLLNLRPKKAPKIPQGKKKITREDSEISNFLVKMVTNAKKEKETSFLSKIKKEVLENRENDEYAQLVGGKIVMINKEESAQDIERDEEMLESFVQKEIIKELYKVKIDFWFFNIV